MEEQEQVDILGFINRLSSYALEFLGDYKGRRISKKKILEILDKELLLYW